MDINKISKIGKVGEIEGGGFIKAKEKVEHESDTISISSAGKAAQKIEYLKSLAFNAISHMPDRNDKIEIARNRIKEGYYNNYVEDIVNSLLNPPI